MIHMHIVISEVGLPANLLQTLGEDIAPCTPRKASKTVAKNNVQRTHLRNIYVYYNALQVA
jgi:hypothetical protein